MSNSASTVNIIFFALVALYLGVQTMYLLFETHSAEIHANSFPPQFRGFITLPEHRKATDYTGEILQCDLMNAVIGAGVAILFTIAGGLNFLWGTLVDWFGKGLLTNYLLTSLVIFFLVVIDLPFSWWKKFRVNERYGYERTPAKQWNKKHVLDTLVGWVILQPFLVVLFYILEQCSYYWWLAIVFGLLIGYLWFFFYYRSWFLIHSSDLTRITDEKLTNRLDMLLKNSGYKKVQYFSKEGTTLFRHTYAVLLYTFRGYRLVIFKNVLDTLSEEEILAVTSCAIAEKKCHLQFFLFVILFSFALVAFYLLSLLTDEPYFFEGLGLNPALVFQDGFPAMGPIVVLLLTVAPIALYPFVFLIHIVTRSFVYFNDWYAVRMVGAEPLIRALVKLHKDYKNTLTPHIFYSIGMHQRPHITSRIENALYKDKRRKQQEVRFSESEQAKTAALFNQLVQNRLNEKEAANIALIDKANLKLQRDAELARQRRLAREAY